MPSRRNTDLGTVVQLGGVGHDLVESEFIKGEVHSCDGALGGIAMAPDISGEGPADVDRWAKGAPKVRGSKAREAEQTTIVESLDRPQPETVLTEAALDLVDQIVALLSIKGARRDRMTSGSALMRAKASRSSSVHLRYSSRLVCSVGSFTVQTIVHPVTHKFHHHRTGVWGAVRGPTDSGYSTGTLVIEGDYA